MSLLLVGNGSVSILGKVPCKDKHLFSFISELSNLIDDLSYMEPAINSSLNEGVSDHNILTTRATLCLLEKSNENKFKWWFYMKSLVRIARNISNMKIGYFFYPGKVPVIASIFSIILGKPYGLYVRGEFRRSGLLYKLIVKKAKFILCTGEKFRKELLLHNSWVSCVTPMIDITIKDLYVSRCYKEERRNLLYVGNISVKKGIWILLQSFEKLSHERPDLHLHIVGGGADYEALQQRIDEKKLSMKVTLYGLVSSKEKLTKIYQLSHILIQPSPSEGFPRVLYEAMCNSLVIITTAVGSISSVMKNNENCLYTKSSCPESLSANIKLLLKSPEKCEMLSKNALVTISKFIEKKKSSHAILVKEHLDKLVECV